MAKYLINLTENPIVLEGREIPADSAWQIPIGTEAQYGTSDPTIAAITAEEIAVSSDGVNPIESIAQQIAFLQGTSLNPVDSDNARIVRIKAAKNGWTYASIPMEFKTSTLGSLYSKDQNGTARSWITAKFYNSDNNEVTTAGLLGINETTIVKTVIDFEPPYDYEVIGGDMRVMSNLSQDCRLWIIAVPDVPENMGGSKDMCSGLNLKYLDPSNIMNVDGRVSKYLKYDATYHTNKLRLIFKHPAGMKHDMMISIELYKQ